MSVSRLSVSLVALWVTSIAVSACDAEPSAAPPSEPAVTSRPEAPDASPAGFPDANDDQVPYALDVPFKATRVVPMPTTFGSVSVEKAAQAKRGLELLSRTYELLPNNVGNQLHCTTCHLQGGKTAKAAPWVGLNARFPQFRHRSAKVDSLKERVNNCFERSMAGTALDDDSEEMAAILAYYDTLSVGFAKGESPEGRGIPKLDLERAPDRDAGKALYAVKCAACHGQNGEGNYGPDGKTYVFPALWGSAAYNVAAGMARQRTAAGFIKHNMPLGQGGTLTDDEAWDIAAYVIHQDRPDFAKKAGDWPQGHKPKDARY